MAMAHQEDPQALAIDLARVFEILAPDRNAHFSVEFVTTVILRYGPVLFSDAAKGRAAARIKDFQKGVYAAKLSPAAFYEKSAADKLIVMCPPPGDF